MATKITLLLGDITRLKVDAIVNAANSQLMGGGGVDGAIHKAGGSSILAACKIIISRQGLCQPGQSVITTAGNLNAKHVIHTVGPIWKGGRNNEEQLLSSCYHTALQLALDNGMHTIAFPNISTGIYGFPKKPAAQIAIQAVDNFLHDHPAKFDEITFACFDEENLSIYQQILSTKKI